MVKNNDLVGQEVSGGYHLSRPLLSGQAHRQTYRHSGRGRGAQPLPVGDTEAHFRTGAELGTVSCNPVNI